MPTFSVLKKLRCTYHWPLLLIPSAKLNSSPNIGQCDDPTNATHRVSTHTYVSTCENHTPFV